MSLTKSEVDDIVADLDITLNELVDERDNCLRKLSVLRAAYDSERAEAERWKAIACQCGRKPTEAHADEIVVCHNSHAIVADLDDIAEGGGR